MANREKIKESGLPANYDPYDTDIKTRLHELADAKNYVMVRRGWAVLCCGAKAKKKEGFCKSVAGAGTQHPGYGRCKYCGGSNTGPQSAEAKAKVAQNGRKHGFYSKVLSAAERDTYEELLETKKVGLEDEIFMQKAKILSYLERATAKSKAGYAATKQFFTEGDTKGYYHVGTIEDRPLQRALETLRRLVDSHAKLTGTNSEDLIGQINAELRAASQQKQANTWGAVPQQSKEGDTT